MKTKQEVLTAYRAMILEIGELETQLKQVTPSGRPAGYRGIHFGEHEPSTNDPVAAALQLADGIEAMIQRKREELAALNPEVFRIVSAITDGRVFQIIHNYYLCANTEERTGRIMGLSTSRVNQLRHQYLSSAS